eukprot:TRINITY_DN42074_c0_g2_i1.p1 TRINITY_DN42074_c0_g2~~TRINITY_DN42074_c0_g2_i1.p1  ORF type:complete len:177 (+),score=40.48 TRINITY_DN42074_c0_g2_i1:218-748(+)
MFEAVQKELESLANATDPMEVACAMAKMSSGCSGDSAIDVEAGVEVAKQRHMVGHAEADTDDDDDDGEDDVEAGSMEVDGKASVDDSVSNGGKTSYEDELWLQYPQTAEERKKMRKESDELKKRDYEEWNRRRNLWGRWATSSRSSGMHRRTRTLHAGPLGTVQNNCSRQLHGRVW